MSIFPVETKEVPPDRHFVHLTLCTFWYLLARDDANTRRGQMMALNRATEDISAELGNWRAEDYRKILSQIIRDNPQCEGVFKTLAGKNPNPYVHRYPK
jgi:hypothetical protein